MKILSTQYLFYLTICFFLFYSCTEEEATLINEDLIFSNSYQIKIPGYTYFDSEGNSIFVRGDSSYLASYPDTLNSLPLLAWDSIGLKLIIVAIFTSPIIVSNNEIVNFEDIIWEWHSGMNFGKEGYVQYLDGRDVINGEIGESVTPLHESTYYWGVWAWNSNGKKILYSSRALEFYVLN
jgi:hypothetical protein